MIGLPQMKRPYGELVRHAPNANSQPSSQPACRLPAAYLQKASPSPAAGSTGFGTPTAIPQVTPGMCGCVSVADQVLNPTTSVGVPTPAVC